jgi:hypothetical protein
MSFVRSASQRFVGMIDGLRMQPDVSVPTFAHQKLR